MAINKRTVYNKAIDTIVDAMVAGHDNEAEQYIYFHDSLPGGHIASAERAVEANREELTAITQYRYNFREMFNTNEFNKNPKNDVFRYMNLSEVLRHEFLEYQEITIIGGTMTSMDILFQAKVNDDSIMNEPTVLFYYESPVIGCILKNINNFKGYCTHDYSYSTMNTLIDFVRPTNDTDEICIRISERYAKCSDNGTIKTIGIHYIISLTKDHIETSITANFDVNFMGLHLNKDIFHSVSNSLFVNGKGETTRNREFNVGISATSTVTDNRLRNPRAKSSEIQSKTCMVTDTVYDMDGVIAICEKATKLSQTEYTDPVVLNVASHIENHNEIMKKIKSRERNKRPLCIVPVKINGATQDCIKNIMEKALKDFDADYIDKSHFIFVVEG